MGTAEEDAVPAPAQEDAILAVEEILLLVCLLEISVTIADPKISEGHLVSLVLSRTFTYLGIITPERLVDLVSCNMWTLQMLLMQNIGWMARFFKVVS